MPILNTLLEKRLGRWMLFSEQPAPLSLEHPAQQDIADAIDEIQKLTAANEELIRGMTEMATRFNVTMARHTPEDDDE